jgi:hypothetical protein
MKEKQVFISVCHRVYSVSMWIWETQLIFVTECDLVYEYFEYFFPFQIIPSGVLTEGMSA